MRSSKQRALLVISTIDDGHTDALEQLFRRMVDEQDVEDNQWIPFRLLKTIHFARLFILPASTDIRGRAIPAQLLFSTNYDGSLSHHLAEIVDVAGESGLDEIYQHCHGYPASATRESRIAYLRTHQASYSAFYVGTVGRTVQQIRQESKLREAIQGFLNLRDSWEAMGSAEVRKAVQDFVFIENKDRFDWALTPPAPWLTFWTRFVKRNTIRILFALAIGLIVLLVFRIVSIQAFLAFLGVLAVLALLIAIVLRYKETHDVEYNVGKSCPTDHLAQEDFIVQNQLNIISNMKPGWFRLSIERLVQTAINFIARYFSNDGNLGGIPSIHFARWAIIDDGRRLLFMSNFDGSWENYLGDFIDKAADGLTAVWSNTVVQERDEGFPTTKWLYRKGGARDEQRFKAFARAGQIPSNVWYSAYKELSVQNINNNSMIRAGLYGDLSPEETDKWLLRL